MQVFPTLLFSDPPTLLHTGRAILGLCLCQASCTGTRISWLQPSSHTFSLTAADKQAKNRFIKKIILWLLFWIYWQIYLLVFCWAIDERVHAAIAKILKHKLKGNHRKYQLDVTHQYFQMRERRFNQLTWSTSCYCLALSTWLWSFVCDWGHQLSRRQRLEEDG